MRVCQRQQFVFHITCFGVLFILWAMLLSVSARSVQQDERTHLVESASLSHKSGFSLTSPPVQTVKDADIEAEVEDGADDRAWSEPAHQHVFFVAQPSVSVLSSVLRSSTLLRSSVADRSPPLFPLNSLRLSQQSISFDFAQKGVICRWQSATRQAPDTRKMRAMIEELYALRNQSVTGKPIK